MTTTSNPYTRRLLIIFASLFALAVILLWLMRAVLAPFGLVLLLVYLLEPMVTRLSHQRLFGRPVSRGIAVATLYSCVVVTIAGLVMILVPRFTEEITGIAHDLPKQVDTLRQIHIPHWEAELQAFSDHYGLGLNAHKVMHDSIASTLRSSEMEARTLSDTVRHFLAGAFDTLMTTVLVLLVTALLLRDAPKAKLYLWQAVPPELRADVRGLTGALSRDLNGAIRGQLLICLINGILTTIGMMLLGMNYAVTIGIIAGICSLIPVFGTVISMVPAVLIALTSSWLMALEVVGVILLIHLIEANFLNPKVMGHNVELHPAIILSALYVAEHYFGVFGLLLAVPVAAAVRSIVRFSYERYIALQETHEAELIADAEIAALTGEPAP